jgi:hypothetical protein
MRYARNLHYEEDPDYILMKTLFKKVMEDNQMENDNKFDWIKENERDIISTNFTSNRNQQPVNVKSYIFFESRDYWKSQETRLYTKDQ